MWIVRRLQDSGFPQPIRFSDSKTSRRFWRLADVEAWERERAHQRSAS
jgi:predicted DNA-binding transcriptional regulator AlpA